MNNGKVKINGVKGLNEVKGVIYGKELNHLTEEQITRALQQYDVTEVKRLIRNEGNKVVPNGIHIITFNRQLHSRQKSEGHACITKSCKNCPEGQKDHCPTNAECPEFLFEKVVQRMNVQKKITYKQAKFELLKLCEENSQGQQKTFASQVVKDNGIIVSLEKKIIDQQQQNEREKSLNVALKKLLLEENEEIMKERMELLRKLKEQREQRIIVEKMIVQYGGEAMSVANIPKDMVMESEDEPFIDSAELPYEKEEETNTQRKRFKIQDHTGKVKNPEGQKPLNEAQKEQLLKKNPTFKKTIIDVEQKFQDSELVEVNWYLIDGSLMYQISNQYMTNDC